MPKNENSFLMEFTPSTGVPKNNHTFPKSITSPSCVIRKEIKQYIHIFKNYPYTLMQHSQEKASSSKLITLHFNGLNIVLSIFYRYIEIFYSWELDGKFCITYFIRNISKYITICSFVASNRPSFTPYWWETVTSKLQYIDDVHGFGKLCLLLGKPL